MVLATCVVTWLPAFRPGVPSTRLRYSVKATGVTVNLDNVGVGDVMGKVARTIDMMLY